MTENEISYEIRGAIFDVYNKLGPGLLESVYEMAMAAELRKRGLKVERQVRIPVVYGEEVVEDAFRLDLLVEQKVIIELGNEECSLLAIADISQIDRQTPWSVG